LDIDSRDEMIEVAGPLKYEFTVQALEGGLLARGDFLLPLNCQCVRCLKPFNQNLELKDWPIHVALEGEDALPVVNDCVDLTPAVREDILLEFPQHPLCDPECRGLPKTSVGKAKTTAEKDDGLGSSPWSELNKLKF
jgi:uncharacterized protein